LHGSATSIRGDSLRHDLRRLARWRLVAPDPSRAHRTQTDRTQQIQQNKDQAQCQNTANVQATSSESWAQIFAACMSGRGYGVRLNTDLKASVYPL
jgi:hypothetical protein